MMMQPGPNIRPVPNDLPVYPIAATERLDGNSFVKWNTARWIGSRTFKLMAWDMQGMARALFDLCQMETPVGTLPDDDRELAFLLRCDPLRLRELRAMEFGPLRNWGPCLCDGKVRLSHPVVTEQVQDALDRRALARLSEDQRATAMRLDRMKKALRAQELSAEVVGDDVLMERMDAWLKETHKTRRTAAVYRSAILHAVQHRWFDRSAWRG